VGGKEPLAEGEGHEEGLPREEEGPKGVLEVAALVEGEEEDVVSPINSSL
jgi:hypothetical protein